MQRILTTTTILALSAGFASAEVTLSGDARMGIISDFGDAETAFTSRARVSFTLSGESDNGLEFGASFRADNAGSAASGTAGSVFVSGAGGKLSMGDVDGAAAAAVGQVDGVGLTGLSDLNENFFLSSGGLSGYIAQTYAGDDELVMTSDPTALFQYSAGSLTVYASLTQPSYSFPIFGDTIDGTAYSAAVAYTMGDYKLSAGYEKVDMISQTGLLTDAIFEQVMLGVDATLGAVVLKARYGMMDVANDLGPFSDLDQWALSATYTTGALGLTAYASSKSEVSASGGLVRFARDAYGVGASYDLGGGAKLVGGYAHKVEERAFQPTIKDSAFDLGLSFSF